MVSTQIPLASIRLDGGTQPRTAISEETVANYAEHMQAMAPVFPPVVLFFDGADHWLADGFHRCHAAKQIGREEIAADIRTGTRRDAVLFSVCANQTHGLQRTRADKRKAVATLLQDEEWRQWSNSEIARRCGVTHTFVGDVRRGHRRSSQGETSSLVPSTSERAYTTKHGTEATMNTENIGKSKPMIPDRSKAAIAQRRQDLRDMAGRGFTTRQIAATLDMTEKHVAEIAKAEGVVIHADRVMAKTKRIDPNRVIEQMAIQAASITADVDLIDFAAIDRARLPEWLSSLKSSRDQLGVFIRRLMKEQQNVEVA